MHVHRLDEIVDCLYAVKFHQLRVVLIHRGQGPAKIGFLHKRQPVRVSASVALARNPYRSLSFFVAHRRSLVLDQSGDYFHLRQPRR